MGDGFPKNYKGLNRESTLSKVRDFGSHLGPSCKLSSHGPQELACSLNLNLGGWRRDSSELNM